MAALPKFDLPSRATHVIAAFCVGSACLVTMAIWPGLIKDTPTTFSKIGFFITLYGVIFTIVEVLRAKAAATLASEAVKTATSRFKVLYDSRDSVECQTLVENALDMLNKDDMLSPSSLGRIVKLYAAEFSTSYEHDSSPHRQRVAMVTSFVFSASGSRSSKVKRSDKLKAALVEMIADLAASNGRRLHKEP